MLTGDPGLALEILEVFGYESAVPTPNRNGNSLSPD